MDELHLTYDDVVYKIPYRNLVIMQKDKLRVCHGRKVVEVDDSEFIFGKTSKNNKKRTVLRREGHKEPTEAQDGTNILRKK